jgi:drug/metabolite transporter (DMT)-like permease
VNATLLNNATPLFIPIISFLWLKNIIDKKIWWGILTGLTGIILILKPSPSQLIKEGDLFGLAAGVFLAIAYVALKILTKTESFITVLFYYALISVVLSLPFAIYNWSNPPLLIWIYGVLTGVCFVSYLFLLQYAYRFVDPVKLSPFNYSIVVFTGIFDWIIFNNVPGILTIAGIILVSAGGILALKLHESDNKQLKHSVHG